MGHGSRQPKAAAKPEPKRRTAVVENKAVIAKKTKPGLLPNRASRKANDRTRNRVYIRGSAR